MAIIGIQVLLIHFGTDFYKSNFIQISSIAHQSSYTIAHCKTFKFLKILKIYKNFQIPKKRHWSLNFTIKGSLFNFKFQVFKTYKFNFKLEYIQVYKCWKHKFTSIQKRKLKKSLLGSIQDLVCFTNTLTKILFYKLCPKFSKLTKFTLMQIPIWIQRQIKSFLCLSSWV